MLICAADCARAANEPFSTLPAFPYADKTLEKACVTSAILAQAAALGPTLRLFQVATLDAYVVHEGNKLTNGTQVQVRMTLEKS